MKDIRWWLPDTLALFVLSGITIVSVVPFRLNYHTESVVTPDVIGHFACYFILGFCALYRRNSLASAALTALAIITYGGLIELVQSHLGRSTSFADFAANTLGTLSAWAVLVAVRKLALRGELKRDLR